jgi:MarR family transcriptional regulator, 2-MHQ and catechol-resistance regulon repressor
MTPVDSSLLTAWGSFIRAKAGIRRIVNCELRQRGLGNSQLDILRVLAEAGSEGAKLNEISQQLYVTSANVTGLIDRLEEAGYLARVAHKEDRRITLAVLTENGRKLFDEVYPVYLEHVKCLMSALTPTERTQFADFMDRIADRAAEMREK